MHVRRLAFTLWPGATEEAQRRIANAMVAEWEREFPHHQVQGNICLVINAAGTCEVEINYLEQRQAISHESEHSITRGRSRGR